MESTYRRGRNDYANIYAMACDESQESAYVDESEYYDMLECLPPIYLKGLNGFLVGEALTGGVRGTVYAHYFKDSLGHYRARYHLVPTSTERR